MCKRTLCASTSCTPYATPNAQGNPGVAPAPPARVVATRSPVAETKKKEKERRAKIHAAQVGEAGQVDADVAELLRELISLVPRPPGKARDTGLFVSELKQLRKFSSFAGQGQADVAGSVELDPLSFDSRAGKGR